MGLRSRAGARRGRGTGLSVGLRRNGGHRPSGIVGQRSDGPRLAAFALIAFAVLSLWAGPAAAQDDPYGSTSTTGGNGTQPSCQLRTRSAHPGETVTVRLRAIPRGEEVEVRLDGEVVARATASSSGSSPRVSFDVDFVVPSDTVSGEHDVTAVGAAFTASCTTGNGDRLEVQADSEVRGIQQDRGGSLPRTGIYIALLLAVAVALLLVGRAVLKESRRRARAAALDRRHHRQTTGSHRP
jgi:hypothetical protein